MKKYDEYKDSGVEWIGSIPEHWEIRKLKFLAKIITGYTPSMNNTNNYSKLGLVWVKPDNLHKFSPVYDSKEKISSKVAKKRNVIPAGSVLVCCIGSVGKIGVAGTKLITNQQINSIIFNKKLIVPTYGKFLIYASKDEHIRNANGNVVKILNTTNQGKIFYPFPPIEIQNKIAAYLDKKQKQANNFIQKQEKMIVLLKEQKKAIINAAVTGQIVYNGNAWTEPAEVKDSGIEWLGEIPEHWEIRKLKYLVKINEKTLTETTPKKYEFKYIDISSVSENGLICDPEKMNFRNSPSRARRIIREGDTIVSTVRTYLRAIESFTNYNGIPLIASTGFAVLTPKKQIDSNFLKYLVQNEYFLQSVTANSVGIAYPAITTSNMGNFYMTVPIKKEQKEIITYIEEKTNKIDTAISKAEDEIKLTKEYMESLIFNVVTGQVKVD